MDSPALVSRPVPFFGPTAQEVRALYRTSFPVAEQAPLALLHVSSLRPHCHFLAWFEPGCDSPCALTYSYEADDVVFLGYFAVDTTRRSRGVGSRILDEFSLRYKDRTHVLEIEPLDQGAANLDQRLKRLAFYERNGFTSTAMSTRQSGETYRVLVRNGEVTPTRLQRLLDRLSLGMFRTHVDVD